MNWIRQEKRLAIYLRDGLACLWCGIGVEDGAKLSVDHVIPVDAGGGNKETNLITACQTCNSRRGARSIRDFAVAVAAYVNHGLTAEAIVADIRKHTRRSLTKHREEAKAMIARRGSAARVLAALADKEAA